MMQDFGKLPDGRQAHLYRLTSGALTASISDLGATLVGLTVPDRAGQTEDVVLGFDCAQDYWDNDCFLGAVVGRNANRIGNSRIPLENRELVLTPNEGPNNLHSGPDYWCKRLWTLKALADNQLTLVLQTPDGDQGFPGAGEVQVTYTLSPNGLTIDYQAKFNQDTVFNPTNHAYFNLAGHKNFRLAMEQTLCLKASCFTPVDGASIPTGEIAPVAGTCLDFTSPKALGQGQSDPLVAPQGGVDHNFILDAGSEFAAVLTDPHSGRRLRVRTSCPGLQVYTANFLNTQGKQGAQYPPRCGVCLETQYFPDYCHHAGWPQPVAKAGQIVESWTEYRVD